MTHLIIQTGYVEFFNNLTWLSASMLSLANKDDNYVIFAFVKASKAVKDGLVNSGHQNVRLVDMTHFNDMSLAEARKFMKTVLQSHADVATLSIFNGACNSFASVEAHHFACWQKLGCDSYARLQPLKHVAETVYQSIMFVLYELIEEAKLHSLDDLQINNFVEDPLQHKLWQFDGPTVHIKHWYFHRLDNKLQQHEHDWSDSHTSSILTNFDFSPSQQHFYWHGLQKIDLFKHENRKHLLFAFSMTNVWKDRTERTTYIDNMMHLHNSECVKQGIVFRFFSRAKHQQMLSDKLLPYATYLELLKSAKYTLIIPSYDSNCFSLRRFAEALSVGCVPLVHEDCKLYMFDGTQRNFIEDRLLLTSEDIESLKSAEQRQAWMRTLTDKWESNLLACHDLFIKPYVDDDIYVKNLKQCKLL